MCCCIICTSITIVLEWWPEEHTCVGLLLFIRLQTRYVYFREKIAAFCHKSFCFEISSKHCSLGNRSRSLLRQSLWIELTNTNALSICVWMCVCSFACNNNSDNNRTMLENRARRKGLEKGRLYRRVTSIQTHIQAATVAKWQPKFYVFCLLFCTAFVFFL